MQTFTDRFGKEWKIELTLDKAMAIESWNFADSLGRAANSNPDHKAPAFVGIAFINPDEELFTRYITHPKVCYDMIWCCVRDEAMKGGIENHVQFAERLDGRSFEEAKQAFYREIPSFFPTKATTLRVLISKYSAVEVATDQRMAKVIEQNLTDDELAKVLDQAEKKAGEDFHRIYEASVD